MQLKCASCVSEYLEKMNSNGDADWEMVNEGITLVPAWQMQTMGVQQIVACVALPTCMKHIGMKETSAAERALSSGLLLPGPVL